MGDRIKELREEKGWKQEKLASESGTSKSYISLLEANQRYKDTSVYKLKSVADALGTSVDYLISGRSPFVDINEIDPELKEIYMELLNQNNLPFYRKSGALDREGLKSILEFIRFIKQKAKDKSE